MAIEYSIKEHGDLLEKEAGEFIETYFPNYERCWSKFVGHKGNGQMTDLSPDIPELNRINYAENSYTALESVFFAFRILESDIFTQPIKSFEEYATYNSSFIAFFAHVGRAHDTVKKAGSSLGFVDENFFNNIKEFYGFRNSVIHGRKVPWEFDDMGLVKIPSLRKWDDKISTWSEIDAHKTEYVYDIIKNTFSEFIKAINSIYGNYLDRICEALKANNSSINFHYTPLSTEDDFPAASGQTYVSSKPQLKPNISASLTKGKGKGSKYIR